MILEPEKFRQFEHAGWEEIPAGYHEAFGGLTTQTIEPLLDAVALHKGMNFLDVASGPGYVAAAAARRGATVLGVDFSTAMVRHAQRLHPGVEFRLGDAEKLPFANGSFDAVAMNFGILHLSRPDLAIGEAYRVLRSGGRFAFSVWCNPKETIGFGIVLRAVEEHGEPRVALPEGPPFFRFSDSAECERALIAAGFERPAISKVSQVWRLPANDGLFNAMKDSTVRTAGLLRAQNAQALDKIGAALRSAVAPYTTGEVVELPMPALVASGLKS